MTAAQMLAHCSVSMQWALGELVPEKGALPARLMGRLVKPMVLRNEDPIRKNAPTAKSLIMADERDLDQKRDRFSGLINKTSGPSFAPVWRVTCLERVSSEKSPKGRHSKVN
jgi:hypothetical protein